MEANYANLSSFPDLPIFPTSIYNQAQPQIKIQSILLIQYHLFMITIAPVVKIKAPPTMQQSVGILGTVLRIKSSQKHTSPKGKEKAVRSIARG